MTGNWLGSTVLAASGSTGYGPEIGRDAAQHLARQELARLARLPLWERILVDIARLLGVTGNAVPAGWFGLIVLGVIVAALIVVILAWTRPVRMRRIRAGAVLGGRARTAQEYRREAARLASAGDYSEAIVEGVRAIAAELEERGILSPRPGRTANELAVEAGNELPALSAGLRDVTRLFDDVRYGDRPGTAAGYELVSRVDRLVQTAQATVSGPQRAAVSELGVPR